jgi:hypothetical protein
MAKRRTTKKEIEPKGIGGWLILPIIGIFLTILLNLFDLGNLYSEGYLILSLIAIGFIVFSIILLVSIFKEKKLARNLGIIFYAIALGVNILSFNFPWAIGNLIWLLYFVNSKRVKNTFINK